MVGKAVILTTHLMEEAEHLSDTIGIIVDGRLQCVDTPSKLKRKYSPGVKLQIHWKRSIQDEAKKRVIEELSDVVGRVDVCKEYADISEFHVSDKFGKNTRAKLFLLLEKSKKDVIVEWSVSDRNLEDVFIEVVDGYK